MDADQLVARLATAPRSAAFAASAAHPKWPATNVRYEQAAVCLAARRETLPTVEEWWLAAKGSATSSSGHRKFAWDASVNARFSKSLDGERVCAGRIEPMDVDQGGIAYGLDPVVHHLAGNAEQWTRSPTDRSATLVMGGTFGDVDEAFFSGEQPRFVQEEDRPGDPEGCHPAFRGVVHPGDFFAPGEAGVR
jgi:formylglycine-generating enzyme required for sulfatase activity